MAAHSADNNAEAEASSLASLFVSAVSDQAENTFTAALQEILLEETLEHARTNSAFWSEKIPPRDTNISAWEALQHIPLFHRSELDAAFPYNLTSIGPGCVYHTSGTGTGVYARFHRSRRETEFLNDFYAAVSQLLASRRTGPRSRWISTCDTFAHGGTIIAESVAHKHIVGASELTDTAVIDRIISILRNPQPCDGVDDQVSVLATTSAVLLLMTLIMRDSKFDRRSLHVRTILHGSSHLPRRAKTFIADYWQAELVSVYSMAEMIGRAVTTPSGLLQFQPNTIMEAVDPCTFEPISNGIGLAAITCLYPFVQLQPRIRYLTNDLVEVYGKETSSICSYRFVGRAENSGYGGGTSWTQPCVRPVQLYDQLDELQGVCRDDLTAAMRELKYTRAFGRPRFKVSSRVERDDCVVRLEIEFTNAGPEKTVGLRDAEDALHGSLISESFCAQPKLEVVAVEPGELGLLGLKA